MEFGAKLKEILEKQGEEAAVKELLVHVNEQDSSLSELKDIVDKLTQKGEAWDELDPKAILEGFESTKASIEEIQKAVKNGGLLGHAGVPGMGDYAHKFSMARLAWAVKTKDFKNAGFEKECCDAAIGHLKSQNVSIPEDGGYFVPFQVLDDVIGQLFARSVLINVDGEGAQTRVNVIDGLTGQQVTLPKFNGGVAAYWMGEEDDYAQSMAQVGDVTMSPKKLGLLVRMSDELRAGAAYGFENLLRRDMTKALALKLDNAILYGKGTTNQPRGVTQNQNINLYRTEDDTILERNASVSDSAGGVWNFDDAINMMGHLEDNNVAIDDSFAFISCPALWRQLRKLKIDNYSTQDSNQPYLLGLPTLTDQELRDALGVDFDKTTAIANNLLSGQSAGWGQSAPGDENRFTDVFAGNWSEVLVGLWGGITITEDQGLSNFIKDQVAIKMRMYADVGYRHEQAVIWSPDAEARTATA